MKEASLVSTNNAKLITGDILQLPCTVNYYYIEKDIQAKEAVEEIVSSIVKEDNIIVIDLETTGIDPYSSRVLTLQVGLANNIQYIFDIRRIDKEILAPVFSLNCWKAGHNIKFDAKFIKHNWKASLTKMYDTYLAEQIIRGGEFYGGGGLSLDAIIEKRLGKDLKIITSDFKSDAKQKTATAKKQMQKSFMNLEDEDQDLTPAQLVYAAQDVSAETFFELINFQIKELNIQRRNMLHNPQVEKYVHDTKVLEEYHKLYPKTISLWATALLEFQFLEVVVDIELSGIGFCQKTHDKVLENIQKDYTEYREDFLRLMAEGAKQETLFGTASINPDSSAQVLKGLQELGLKIEETGADVLENTLKELREESKEYKIVKSLIGYRKSSKLLQAFGDKIKRWINPKTKRIHYEIKQILETGRISTKNINIQQIPSRIEWKMTGDEQKDKQIQDRDGFRECFVPAKGYKYLIYDYSAQELRVAASVSMDSLMLQAFREDKDLHSFSATLMYNEKYEDFMKLLENGDKEAKKKRQAAKLVSFGSLYGSGPNNLSNKLHVDMKDAKEILQRFWAAYPELAQTMPRFARFANDTSYSNTVLGRRRYYNNLTQRIKWVQLEHDPRVIDKKVRDLKMLWLVEEGAITEENIEYAKSKIINKYRGKIGRESGNHAIQGIAADGSKCAAIVIRKDCLKNRIDANIVALIHDEIVVEVREDQVKQCEEIVIKRMEEAMMAFCPNVRFPVEGKVSNSWCK